MHSYVINMNLSCNNLSVLPEDLTRASQILSDLDGDKDASAVSVKGVPVGSYFILLSGIVPLAAMGPMFNMHPSVDPLISSLALLLLALLSFCKNRLLKLTFG